MAVQVRGHKLHAHWQKLGQFKKSGKMPASDWLIPNLMTSFDHNPKSWQRWIAADPTRNQLPIMKWN